MSVEVVLYGFGFQYLILGSLGLRVSLNPWILFEDLNPALKTPPTLKSLFNQPFVAFASTTLAETLG